MPTIATDGTEIYYERHGGEGEPLVFVHGHTGDITDWRHQLPEFSGTHRVLIIDNRGHGRSGSVADRASYTVEQISRDVEAVIEQSGYERYHLLGHSMGGAIAQEIALRNPGRLMSLTLEDTSPGFDRTPPNERMTEFLRRRRALAEEQGMAAVAAMRYPLRPPPHMPPERIDEERQRLSRMSVDGFLGAWQGLREWPGTRERLPQLAVPTLVIAGELEAPHMAAGSRRLAELIPGATLEVIPQCGHSPQYERPELFNAVLRRHLERNASSPP